MATDQLQGQRKEIPAVPRSSGTERSEVESNDLMRDLGSAPVLGAFKEMRQSKCRPLERKVWMALVSQRV